MKSSKSTVFLLLLYLAIIFAPLAMAFAQDLPRRVLNDEAASGMAMLAFAMMCMEFFSSGRFEFITGSLHYNTTMKFHKRAGIILACLIVLHPFLYSSPPSFPPIDDPTMLNHLGLASASILTGWAAWLCLIVLVILAYARKQVPFRYEAWRIMHALGAVIVVGLVLHHALSAGRYSQAPLLATYWLVLASAALLSLLHAFVILPIRMLKRPFRIIEKIEQGEGKWLVTLEPDGFEPKPFVKGQFVWMTMKNPFSLMEHPFTIASGPEDRPRISFYISERGDWTRGIRKVQIGERAYLNGPYG